MGKKGLPKAYHKDRITICLKKPVKRELVMQCEKMGLPISTFIERLLEAALFTEKTYAKYMLSQKRLESAYWEYMVKLSEEKTSIVGLNRW